ncbi:MAG: peptidylprolyl isomerase [Bacteroidetes bacterium]|nr:peptidylprolyl isomerase [Bacteroidota bacterium]
MCNKLPVKLVLFLIISFCLHSASIIAKSNNNLDNQTIMTLGKENITFGEIKRVYNRNYSRSGSSFELLNKDSVKSFLNTYSKLKVKVLYGNSLGYDKDSDVIEEIERNKKLLAESHLLEAEITVPAVKRYTEMRKIQKQVAVIMSHIPLTGDTTEAYQKIMSALTEINRGETFEYAARKYSTDTVTGVNSGVVPVWVTGLRLQRDLESAIYSLKVGEMTQAPIRTHFAYFLIKVLQEESRTFIGVSQILIPYKNENESFGPIIKDTADAKRLADSLVQVLSKGESFNTIAEKFSAERQTAAKGGNIGVYARSSGIFGSGENLDPIIENTLFSLKDKEISQPVETFMGYFIFKRDSTVVYDDNFEYEELKANYVRIFLKNDKEKFYDSLLIEYGFEINMPVFNNILASIDTTRTIFDKSFSEQIPNKLLNERLFSINNISYTVQNYLDTIQSNANNNLISANRSGLNGIIKSIATPIMLEEIIKNAAEKYPVFKATIDEFTDGLISIKVEQENVYNKIKFDSVRARTFYDTTTMDITVPLQYDLSEIYIMSKSKAEEVYQEIKTGKITFDSAVALHSQRQGTREKNGFYGVVNTSNYLAHQAEKNNYKTGDISEPLSFEQGFSIIRINNINPKRKMTFEEALPHISAAVQEDLVKSLKIDLEKELYKKYPIKYNESLINKTFKK